jgi:hypothetical protein
MMNAAKTLTPFLLAFFMVFLGCTKKPEPEGYRVVNYDAATHQWVILRNGTFDGKYLTKRITVVCSFYKWGDHEAVTGPDACHLQVGRMMIPNSWSPPKKSEEYLDVFEMPSETLAITEGSGADQVQQQFIILKYEVLPENANR